MFLTTTIVCPCSVAKCLGLQSDSMRNSSEGYFVPTTLFLCNNANVASIDAAVAWLPLAGDVATIGWFSIKAGECKEGVFQSEQYNNVVQVYGQAEGKTWGGTGNALCIHTLSAFDFPKGLSMLCTGSGENRVVFSNWTSVSRDNVNVWSFNP